MSKEEEIEKLFQEAIEMQERLYPSRKPKIQAGDPHGIVLDPNNPRDREWFNEEDLYEE